MKVYIFICNQLLKFIKTNDPGGGGPPDKQIKHQQPNQER